MASVSIVAKSPWHRHMHLPRRMQLTAAPFCAHTDNFDISNIILEAKRAASRPANHRNSHPTPPVLPTDTNTVIMSNQLSNVSEDLVWEIVREFSPIPLRE